MQTTTPGAGPSPVATSETDRLIASDKVEGTAVYDREGERLGSISNFMVDKRSGHDVYAVMSFGGFLGLGDSCYPLPWKALDYDTSMGGYVVDLNKEQLERAQSYAGQEGADWGDAADGRRIDEYYGYGLYPTAASAGRKRPGVLVETRTPGVHSVVTRLRPSREAQTE